MTALPSERAAEPRAPSRPAGSAGMDDLLRQLRWPVLRRLAVHHGGDERSAMRGVGLEYADVREYQPGDDPRQIDWNLTARSGMVHVRESHPDRGLDVWLLVDPSRSLDWGTARCLKRQAALELAAAATQLLVHRGSRVGAVLLDRRVRRVVPPASGRTALLGLIARLDAALQAGDPGDQDGAAPADLGAALLETGRLMPRRSLVIVISDFLCAPTWLVPLRSLAMRHEVVVAHVIDPREHDIPDIGVVTFEDPETGAQLQVDTSSRKLRERFRRAALEQQGRIRADIVASGADGLELSTEGELLPQLLAFFQRRRAAQLAGSRGVAR